uniref:Uncharacterized protein LOC101498811 n=1 Tax=Cicer arietinum TaxID=3827 RepID=A0A1S2XLB2_CICAR|nr:uncharacterized protein LOC101498811 [Cicer arietinum]
MFDVHKQWPQLGSIELYVTFEDGNPLYDIGQPSSSTTPHLEYHFETQNTYQPDSYQPEPYFDHAETSKPEPSQLELYIPLGDMIDFDQQEISEDSEEETYFDEDEDDEGDNDNGDDLELTYDPPFHMCNLNLDNTYQSSEFDMQSNEPPPLDASLEIGMKASLSQKSNQWVIGRLKGPHNCANSSMSQDHTKLDSNIICESIKSLLKADPSIKVKVIIAHIRERYNYTITYRKAWMAKNKAIETIYGNWEKSYNDLPMWLLTMQKFLPGIIVEMEVSVAYPDNTLLQGSKLFKRLFWAFPPSISGFKFCKSFVSVDGTWLYGKYKGTILLAVAQDGNKNTIPIAFALVEGYALNEPSFKYYRNEIKMENPEALRWIDNIPPEQWTMAYSQDRR